MSGLPLKPLPAAQTVWRPEDPSALFQARARRASVLAGSRQPAGYLQFLAELTQAQHSIVPRFESAVAAPAADAARPHPPPQAGEGAGAIASKLQYCATGLPPLAPQSIALPREWIEALRALLKALSSRPLSGAIEAAVERSLAATPGELEAIAKRLLLGDFAAVEADVGLFVGATLQVCWTRLAAGLDVALSVNPRNPSQCPACGTVPFCSRISAGPEKGSRQLCCSLCATLWHLPRIRCAACGSTEAVTYLGDERLGPAVKAEACEACQTYLKIFYQERDPLAEPLIDDIASLSLDIALEEAGYRRMGANLLLLPGRG